MQFIYLEDLIVVVFHSFETLSKNKTALCKRLFWVSSTLTATTRLSTGPLHCQSQRPMRSWSCLWSRDTFFDLYLGIKKVFCFTMMLWSIFKVLLVLLLYSLMTPNELNSNYCVAWVSACWHFHHSGSKFREFPMLLYYRRSPQSEMALMTEFSFKGCIQVVFPLREVCEVAPASCINYNHDWWHQLFHLFSSLEQKEQMSSSNWRLS